MWLGQHRRHAVMRLIVYLPQLNGSVRAEQLGSPRDWSIPLSFA